MRHFLMLSLGLSLLSACTDTGKEDEDEDVDESDADTDADADSDADADADADADSDADADTDYEPVNAVLTQDDADRLLVELGYTTTTTLRGTAIVDVEAGTIEGEVTYDTTYDGAVECDVASLFTGSTNPDFTGACADCDFVFGIDEAVLDMGASTSSCYANPQLTYVADEVVVDLGFAYGQRNEDGLQRSAAYIASWLEVLKSDSRAIFTAAAKAQAAADWLHGQQAGPRRSDVGQTDGEAEPSCDDAPAAAVTADAA